MGYVKVLVLLLTLFTFHVGAPESKSDQCNDLWIAKKSNKINFCIAEHWSKLKPTGQTDNVCDICLKMVKEARDTLQSNETREQLMEVFEGSCRLLVLKPAVELCDRIVDQLVPELVEILSSEMDPEAVCSVAKLCNNEVFRVAQKNSKECVNCEKFTEAVAKEVESVSSESFENGILNLCRTAGGFSDACFYLGSKYSELLYNNTKIILSKKPCEATTVCPSGLFRSKPVRETKKQMCPLCMKVMTSLREQFLRVKSAEEFSENILSACKRMNFPDSVCSDITSPSLYEKVRSSDKLPEIFCQITYCGQKSDEEIFPIWPLVPANDRSFSSAEELDALELLENLEMFFPVVKEEKTEHRKSVISYGDPIENPVFFAPNLYVDEAGDCKTCAHVFETLSKSAEAGEKYSEGMLSTICESVSDVEMCKQFVSHFSPVLTKAYAEGVVSTKMCEDLAPSCKIKRNYLPEDAASSERTCNFCLNAVRMFNRSDYVSWGQKRCSGLSENSKNMCTSVFGKIHSVFENFTENDICSNLQLCGPSAIILPGVSDANAVVNGSMSLCKSCIDAVTYLSDLSKNPNSEIIAQIVFDSLCSVLPYLEGKMCHTLLDSVGVKNFIKFLQNLEPREVCAEIFLCKKNEQLDSAAAPDLPKITSAERKVPCKFCLMAMRTLLDQLQDDKTEESIRKALTSLCKYFPEETRDTCRNLIDEYTADIIDMIIADFNASEICVYLKLCPARHLLGDADEKDFPVFDIQTNEVRYWDGDSLRWTFESFNGEIGAVKIGKPSKKEFQNFHKVVQECALCEALVGVISTHEKMLNKNYDFSANAHVICAIVPQDKKRMCMTMVVSYGPSIVNLLTDQKVDPNEVCVRVDLCDPKMQAKVNQPVSVVEEKFLPKKENSCLLGPKFWCANAENAKKCGTFLHCQEMVWKNWKNPPRRPSED